MLLDAGAVAYLDLDAVDVLEVRTDAPISLLV